MKKKIITVCLLCSICFLVKTQAQSNLDCAALQKKVATALTESATMRLNYWSSNRKVYANFEQDAQKNEHVFVRQSPKEFTTQSVITVNGKTFYASSDMSKQNKEKGWLEKIPSSFDTKAWSDSCNTVKNAVNQSFSTCKMGKEVKITGTPYTIYEAVMGNDTFKIWINKSVDKIERIYGGHKQKDVSFSLEFNTPFTIAAPPKDLSDKPNFGFANFPPLYSLEEYYDGNERVYATVDKVPEYQKGVAEMFKFIGQNIVYPTVARKNGIEGTIYIGFVVEKDGQMTNFKLKRGVHPELNDEAIRVLKLMSGQWLAGVHNGQKVRVAYTLPIKFKLE